MKNFIKVTAAGATLSLLPIAFADLPKPVPPPAAETGCADPLGTLVLRKGRRAGVWTACEMGKGQYLVREHRLVSGAGE